MKRIKIPKECPKCGCKKFVVETTGMKSSRYEKGKQTEIGSYIAVEHRLFCDNGCNDISL